ncbi:hypothetical protein V2G26_015045 [Clonostachys chloroleuca]
MYDIPFHHPSLGNNPIPPPAHRQFTINENKCNSPKIKFSHTRRKKILYLSAAQRACHFHPSRNRTRRPQTGLISARSPDQDVLPPPSHRPNALLAGFAHQSTSLCPRGSRVSLGV